MTMNIDGKMNSTVGKSILIGAFIARSSASDCRRSRVSAAATVARPASWFTEPYPPAAADAVARAAARDPGARIWSDVRFADWLLWTKPELAGRLAFDARFEVLSRLRIAEIYNFNNAFGSSWRPATDGFSIVVLDRTVSSRPLRGPAPRARGRGSSTPATASSVVERKRRRLSPGP